MPTPPHDLRSIDHVCKCKERQHPTPPHDLRSIDHVCKWKERHHPTPPQPHVWRTARTCAPTRAVFDPVAKTTTGSWENLDG